MFSTSSPQLENAFTNFYYEEMLKIMLDDLQSKMYSQQDPNEKVFRPNFQHLGSLMQNELVLKFPLMDQMLQIIKNNVASISKIEYFRRFLYQLQVKLLYSGSFAN